MGTENQRMSTTSHSNVDPDEIEKFQSIASRWWDRDSEFKPLHDINPLRVDYIDRQCHGLAGKKRLDIGCGGGILAEALATRGAEVTGIAVPKAWGDLPCPMRDEQNYRANIARVSAASSPSATIDAPIRWNRDRFGP